MGTLRSKRSWTFAGVFLVLSACVPRTMAQAVDGIEPSTPDSWRFAVGVGGVRVPRYPGSDLRKTELVPVLSAGYGRFFVGGLPGGGVPLGLGAFLLQDQHWKLGVGLGAGFGTPRRESDDPRLAGLGDIHNTPRAGLFGSFTQDWLIVRSNVATDVGGHDEGTLASIEIEGRYRLIGRLTISAGPGLTWADHKYTQTFFGINAQQSAASGRPEYTVGSGVNSVRFMLGAEYGLTPRWGVGVRASLARLRGDAGNSPITVDKSQDTFGFFTAYRF